VIIDDDSRCEKVGVRAGLHRHAFSWRSRDAVQRVREATAEIEKAKPFRPNSRRKAYRDLSSSLRAL
jgi:hypothetical protein